MDIYKKYVFCVSSELDLNITVLDTGLNLGFFFSTLFSSSVLGNESFLDL